MMNTHKYLSKHLANVLRVASKNNREQLLRVDSKSNEEPFPRVMDLAQRITRAMLRH